MFIQGMAVRIGLGWRGKSEEWEGCGGEKSPRIPSLDTEPPVLREKQMTQNWGKPADYNFKMTD